MAHYSYVSYVDIYVIAIHNGVHKLIQNVYCLTLMALKCGNSYISIRATLAEHQLSQSTIKIVCSSVSS